jgi:isoleucyl-tRNA synthetase
VHEGVGNAPADALRAEDMALAVAVAPAGGGKCERCWIYSGTVGQDDEHAALCDRCAGVVKQL